MTASELERRLAERLEPEPGENEAIRESPGGLWYRSHRTGSSHLSYWIPRPFTTDGNAMLALVRAARDAGYFVQVRNVDAIGKDGPSQHTWSSVWDSNLDEQGEFSHAAIDDWPLAVALAIARAVGVLGADEEVTDG